MRKAGGNVGTKLRGTAVKVMSGGQCVAGAQGEGDSQAPVCESHPLS